MRFLLVAHYRFFTCKTILRSLIPFTHYWLKLHQQKEKQQADKPWTHLFHSVRDAHYSLGFWSDGGVHNGAEGEWSCSGEGEREITAQSNCLFRVRFGGSLSLDFDILSATQNDFWWQTYTFESVCGHCADERDAWSLGRCGNLRFLKWEL